MKYLLFLLLGLSLIGCDEVGDPYENPKQSLSAEVYENLRTSQDTAVILYDSRNHIYVWELKNNFVTKTTSVSESDIVGSLSVGSLLLLLFSAFTMGMFACLAIISRP